MLSLASNAEEYWTTQVIADFFGLSKRQVYRIPREGKNAMTKELQHDTDDELARAIALVEEELGGVVVWSAPRERWRDRLPDAGHDPLATHRRLEVVRELMPDMDAASDPSA